MRISIVTPSFNQASYLRHTIESVLSQNEADVEYVVIDGGSTDGSQEIIREYADRLSYWVSETDRGQSNAINKGFAHATGEIVAWLNSDDLYLPGTLKAVTEYFRTHPDVDCVYGDIRLIDSSGTDLYVRRTIPYHFRTVLFSECVVPQPAAFWRRRLMQQLGGLDESLHYQMDYEYFVRMGARGARFGHLCRPLAAFRLHAQSKTVSEYSARVADANLVIKRRYVWPPLASASIGGACLRALRWLYRLRGYLVRLLYRRANVVPFRATAARRRVQGAVGSVQ